MEDEKHEHEYEEFDEFDREVIDSQLSDLIDTLVKLKQEGYTSEDAKAFLNELQWTTVIIAGALYSNGSLFECSDPDHDHDED